ncbi:hypothetical protein [Legionella brunensis]|uniref:Uncharacterized protein n=1 Tax=Legionella brunensis TaxID=29422 RepID=A0A0W0SP03_9GAMM|nr:hypothetical protein [Legionella brunensis]KTC85027.1 hypothetical protein Lbru_1242 [Legionella brunensis]
MKSKDETKYAFEKEIFNNPAEVYARLKGRLNKEGSLASMPEFDGVVQELIERLNHPFILDLIEHDKASDSPLRGALANQYAQVLLGLRHVALEIELDQEEINAGYPHRPHTKGRYPYQPTLEAISKTMDFFDTVERIAHNNNSPLYHADRYTHYELSFKHKEGMIVIPSSMPLTLEDLIFLRGYAALAFTGISQKTLFTDAYYNTPKDFWVHDANHNRRFMSYDDRYCEKHKCSREEAYTRFAKTINEVILPSIRIEHGMSKEEIYQKNIMKAIYFEFLHEYAFTPDVDSLKDAFRFKAGDPAPFEIMIKNKPKNMEALRMKNNNLQSGVFGAGKNIDSRTTKVKYFHDTVGPNFITSLYNKLTHSFYDNKFFSASDLPPPEERTPELIADAALAVMDAFRIDPKELGLDRKGLILLALNKDVYGNSLGRVEGYPNQGLKQPELRREIVEEVILPARKKELESSTSRYTLFGDDTLVGMTKKNAENWKEVLKDEDASLDDSFLPSPKKPR